MESGEDQAMEARQSTGNITALQNEVDHPAMADHRVNPARQIISGSKWTTVAQGAHPHTSRGKIRENRVDCD